MELVTLHTIFSVAFINIALIKRTESKLLPLGENFHSTAAVSKHELQTSFEAQSSYEHLRILICIGPLTNNLIWKSCNGTGASHATSLSTSDNCFLLFGSASEDWGRTIMCEYLLLYIQALCMDVLACCACNICHILWCSMVCKEGGQ